MAASYKNKVMRPSHVCILGSHIHREFLITVLIVQRYLRLLGSQVVHSSEGAKERIIMLSRTSLVVQWLRICLAMQGMLVRPLVGELRSQMPRGN